VSCVRDRRPDAADDDSAVLFVTRFAGYVDRHAIPRGLTHGDSTTPLSDDALWPRLRGSPAPKRHPLAKTFAQSRRAPATAVQVAVSSGHSAAPTSRRGARCNG